MQKKYRDRLLSDIYLVQEVFTLVVIDMTTGQTLKAVRDNTDTGVVMLNCVK